MRVWLYIFAIVGIGASSILLVDYLGPAPIFCEASGGCDIVRQWAIAEGLGVATPILGLAFFAGTLALALLSARRLLVVWTLGGAALALVFLGIQAFVLHAFC